MSEPVNEFEPRHPHERDGRNEPPVFDAEGRCLVCCRDYAHQLEAEVKSLRKPAGEPVPAHEELAKQFRASHADQIEGTRDALERCAKMLDTYAPDLYPANEKGQVDFARAMMESTASEIGAFVKTLPQWFCDVYPPTEPGVYYVENCDGHGNPRPGLGLLEEGKPFASTIPTKYFGPIRGAMKPWEMVPVEPDAVK